MSMFKPCPYDPLWPIAESNRWKRRLKSQLDRCHPWGTAALVLSDGNKRRAEALLKNWTREGITTSQLDNIADVEDYRFNELDERLKSGNKSKILPSKIRILTLGISLEDWQLHAWLNSLGFKSSTEIDLHIPHNKEAVEWPLVVVQLEPIAPYTTSKEQAYLLAELAHAHSVFDLDERRVSLLRRLGVNANIIPGHGQLSKIESWLTEERACEAAIHLGLPHPKQLNALGNIICLGRSKEKGWTELIRPPLLSIPGFDAIQTQTWQEARSLASWLAYVIDSNLKVVRLNPTDHEIRKGGFRCLEDATGKRVHSFIDPIHPDELIKEITWREREDMDTKLKETPRPTYRYLSSFENVHKAADATVCISLYNYDHTIVRALDSARNQENVEIDLIVVDDKSTDSGAETVRTWIDLNREYFCRISLISHEHNGGLASARNTAFSVAQTEWCFVLDADNVLHPSAVEQCLKLTRSAPEKLAVIHPLIEIRSDEDPAYSDELISEQSWQRSRFIHANHVDAMALVRRSAWEKVGGYQHLPYGWEDYDFWCSLITNGFFGILCPQILAAYYKHNRSMLRTHTQRSIRETSRILQKRHPWLQLPTASGGKEGGL